MFEPQARHQNKIQKVFLLSRFLAKILKVNKIAVKSFLKNLSFGVDFKLQIPPLMYKINKHNISDVRNQVNEHDDDMIFFANAFHQMLALQWYRILAPSERNFKQLVIERLLSIMYSQQGATPFCVAYAEKFYENITKRKSGQ